MNSIDNLPVWAAVPMALLLVASGSVILVGAIGLLRLPTFYQRIHGPAITVTLGTGLLLVTSMLYFSILQSRIAAHGLIIMAFIFMTAPVTAMMIMRAGVYRDLRAKKHDPAATPGDVYLLPRKE